MASKPAKSTQAQNDPAEPEFAVENLQRHEHERGRAYWSADLVLEDGRIGVDNLYGSWSIYERSNGEALRRSPGEPGDRRELLSFAAAKLQALVRGEQEPEEQTQQTRRSR